MSDDSTNQPPARKRLGKGLAALIGDLDSVAPSVARAEEAVTSASANGPL